MRKSNFNKIQQELNKLNSPKKGSFKDDRYWKPGVGKDGNGTAVVRFLPEINDAAVPVQAFFTHEFKGPTGQWYIENCRSTIKEKDPVNEYNSQFYNTGNEADKKGAQGKLRKKKFVANILVVKDPLNPENEGKVFLYKFGPKILEKLNEAMFPSDEFEDSDNQPEGFNVFDALEGANFKIRIRQVAGFWNYDKSFFESPSALFDGDSDKIEAVMEQCHDLAPIAECKSYEVLQARLDKVMGLTTDVNVPSTVEESQESKPSVTTTTLEEDEIPNFGASKDESGTVDDEINYLQQLADDS